MAESAVTFVLERFVPFLEQEVNRLRGVWGEVEYIRDELESIRGFLRDADAREESEEVKAWVNQVRDIAYDIEDTIDEFTFRLPQHQRRRFLGFLYKTIKFVKHLKPRSHLAAQIQFIKSKVLDVSERRLRYGLNFHEQGSSSDPVRDTWYDIRGVALHIEEAELVAIDNPREKLIGWLLEGESRREVVSVYGMGGSGKTTLVKKVYDHQRVKKHFQHRAWITVSKSFKITELIKDMIKQLWGKMKQSEPQGVDTMNEDTLKETVNDFLKQKRYVIILDDIWSKNDWEVLKNALPYSNCGSRIMVTTRFYDIASFCIEHYGHVHNQECLGQKDSETLFYKKTFQENSCPHELQELSKKFLKRCGGLPLAIVAIGGVLLTKEKIVTEWDMVYRSFDYLLETDDKLKSMRNILSLSYNDLPYFLKPCLLYLGFFPEDYIIGSSKLIKLWTAEGFVRENKRMTIEEVAKSHLHELINRSLIQVVETGYDGRVKKCRVHDLIHDIILSKLRAQKFGAIADEHNTKLLEKVRRLFIYKSVDNVPQNKTFSHLRSLFMFEVVTIPKSYVHAFFSSIRLLRVLDLTDAPLEKLPNEIANLFHLRYLSLKGTKIKKLPKSIGKLQNLETLDLKRTNVRELPSDLFRLKHLRSLLVYKYERALDILVRNILGFYGEVGIGNLVNLQELLYIDVNQGGIIVRELGRLSQLRRLGILELRRDDGPELCSSIDKMKSLRHLVVTSQEEEVLDLHFPSSPPPLLQNLYLRGHLENFPNWISLLQNLKNIYLVGSRLKDDPLGALQALPSLMELTLTRAYDGEELCFKAGGFQTLKILYLTVLKRLKFVRVEDGAMPHLEVLWIVECEMLEEVPIGDGMLENVKFFNLAGMTNEFLTFVSNREADI
ncbi:hypothetical protein HHK36_020324 [Tetracentron sinense]|uniref:Disease resistance protein RPM1-like n=1 Tax=Tetracentron sinense TaxID=13715 RepID=A0A834YRE6_TETSI|nr:hypothetical protein HHK36_020324 [Tetracentron sinense]